MLQGASTHCMGALKAKQTFIEILIGAINARIYSNDQMQARQEKI